MKKMNAFVVVGKERIKKWLKAGKKFFLKKENLFIMGSGLFTVLLVVVVIIMVFAGTRPTASVVSQVQQPAEVIESLPRHPLTGAKTDAPLAELPQVFGVMIENSADAWPLAGLDEAFLVIEAPVEGLIPRFIAFFDETTEAKKIGPVRSARPYYLDWNDELDGVYTHVGGSPEGLDFILQYDTHDLNEFFQGEYFYRQNGSRYAPHNTYITGDRLRDSLDELQLDAPQYDTWLFKDDKPAEAEGKSLTLDWGPGSTYDALWKYGVNNTYVRDQIAATPFLENYQEVVANNVVVMVAEITVIDSVGRRHIATVGGGRALVAQDGRIIYGTWQKEDRTSRLRFYDEQGAEVHFNAGQTWVEIVSALSQATVTP